MVLTVASGVSRRVILVRTRRSCSNRVSIASIFDSKSGQRRRFALACASSCLRRSSLLTAPPHQLHGPHRDPATPGKVHRTLVLVDHHAPNAQMPQREGHRQPDGPGTDDQYVTPLGLDHLTNVTRCQTVRTRPRCCSPGCNNGSRRIERSARRRLLLGSAQGVDVAGTLSRDGSARSTDAAAR